MICRNNTQNGLNHVYNLKSVISEAFYWKDVRISLHCSYYLDLPVHSGIDICNVWCKINRVIIVLLSPSKLIFISYSQLVYIFNERLGK